MEQSRPDNKTKRKRRRDILYYNPPYSKLLVTNLSYEVRKIVIRCFPKDNRLSKVINKNTIKTSFCTTANLAAKIKQHNDKIIRKQKQMLDKNKKTCSCGKNDICPLEGKCLTSSVVYNAEVRVLGRQKLNAQKLKMLENIEKLDKAKNDVFKPKEFEFYTGLTEGTLKAWNYKYNFDFRHRDFEKRTNLSKYIWKLKDHFYDYSIKWKILSLAKSYNPASKSCNLCSKEKFYIIFKPEISTLNDNNEIFKKCKHRRKCLIGMN